MEEARSQPGLPVPLAVFDIGQFPAMREFRFQGSLRQGHRRLETTVVDHFRITCLPNAGTSRIS
ncbi:hypothetical protein OUZ56_024564 [Daphnia magna]|uniref:Uncharacterized protein n=1 Tax=Daphnia magna TaxID=35525 RepID=A0ABR0B0Y9_9CRUS|nr:hypothetical protein OUZ56_024564 [Daphnia magna]